MKNIRYLIGIVSLFLVLLVSFGVFSLPKVESGDSENFSSERVADDIEVIASEPHSVEHPQALEKVRNYLVDRLVEMGGEPQIHRYDSIKFRYGGYFDIGNVFCQFDPSSSPADSYVMLIAHIDSRFRQTERQKTVYSFGACDDAYGVGTILELLSQALKYRDDWKQGVKILFTDAEENALDGMKAEVENRGELFKDVGFVVNLEARGVKGPVLLFETSVQNDKVMELYSNANYKAGYSLTTVVYRFLPNSTDFTCTKEWIPGINFSCIDDINYYHIDDDNFDNINLSTIQHYGSQLEPILKEYLTSAEYTDTDALKGEEDLVFFGVPLLGMFTFTEGQYTLLCAIIFALFCLALVLNLSSGSATFGGVIQKSVGIFFVSLLVLGIGEGAAYLAAYLGGVDFDIVDTKYLPFSRGLENGLLVLLILGYLMFYIAKRKRSKLFNIEMLLGAMMVLLVFSVVLFFTIGENFFFAVPLLLASVALIFNIVVFLNILSLPSLLLIALLGGSFLYALSKAITVGAIGVIMFMAFYYIILVVGLFECYMNQKRW